MSSPQYPHSFDSKDFDPISYINSRFPDEASLVSLDSEINSLKSELQTLNTSLLSSIHSHSLLTSELHSSLSLASSLTSQTMSEVSTIKEKAEKSEKLVFEMCKDIKSLDVAKKNLTFSITSLKKFVGMLMTVEKLREGCEGRRYKDVKDLLLAFEDFSIYFKKYESVPQILEIYKEKESIVRELKLQIEEDFISFNKGNTSLKPKDLNEMCEVIEALGVSFKNEIVKKICAMIMKPYVEVFRQNENANLENTERRYGWLLRNLKEFDNQYSMIFPEYWGITCHLIYEFCSLTRLQVTETLEAKAHNADVAVLMKALQSTLKFEGKVQEDMKKQYTIYLSEAQRYYNDTTPNKLPCLILNEKNVPIEFVITSLPKFRGSISDSFEPYLKPYVKKEEEELRQNIYNSLSNDEVDFSSDLKVLNSSLFLFNHIKTLLKRAGQYSRSQTMFDIYQVIKRSLKFYMEELVIRIGKEANKKDLEGVVENGVCFIINTAEYCRDTLSSLAESIKMNLDSPFVEKVDLSNEEDTFNSVINKGIDALLNFLDYKEEFEFPNMLKIAWDRLERAGDASEYIRGVKISLEKHIKNVRSMLSEVYFIFYLNKVVILINNKFINYIYKTKKINEVGIQQLQLDIFEIRLDLINLSKGENEKAIMSFTNFVNKNFQKNENLLKLLAMNKEKFVENFRNFYEDANNLEIEKILALKGLKKGDVPSLFK